MASLPCAQPRVRLVQALDPYWASNVAPPVPDEYIRIAPRENDISGGQSVSRSFEPPQKVIKKFSSLEEVEQSILSLPRIDFEQLLPSISSILDREQIYGTRPLLLEEASREALANNFDLKLEAINPQIENAALLDALAEFEPTLNFNINRSSADQAALTAGAVAVPQGQGEVQVDATFSVDAPNRFGGLLQFTNESMFQTVVDEVRSVTPVIRYTQSVLQGGGKQSNLALIRAANLSTTAAFRQVEFAAIETVRDVETAYWELHFQQQNLRAIAWTTEAAYDNLKLVAELRWAGEAGVRDYLRTYSTYQGFKQQLDEAIEANRLAERNLKNLVLLSDAPVDSAIRLELISANDDLLGRPPQIDRRELVQVALATRPDFEAAEFSINAVKQELVRARNDRLPQLDVFVEGSFASQRTNGVLDPASNDQDINQFNFGIETTLPLRGNRQAKSMVRELMAELQTNLTLRDQLRVTIIREVNDAVDQLELSFKRLQSSDKAAQTAIRLYKHDFEIYQKLEVVAKKIQEAREKNLEVFEQGEGPEEKLADVDIQELFNVESLFQITLSANQAMSDLFQTRTDYRIAETNLMTAVGGLLESRNLIWCNCSIGQSKGFSGGSSTINDSWPLDRGSDSTGVKPRDRRSFGWPSDAGFQR